METSIVYTAKHIPVTVESTETDKIFFVFGGAITYINRYLFCMIGEHNQKSGRVALGVSVFPYKSSG